MVKGCNCSYDGDYAEVNSRIFNGEPFCDVNLHSSCPDLLIYTDCVEPNAKFAEAITVECSPMTSEQVK